MGTENIGGINVTIQASDADYRATMARAARTAQQTGQQMRQALSFNDAGRAADRYFTGVGNHFNNLARRLRAAQFGITGALGALGGVFTARQFQQQAGGFEQQMNIMEAVSGSTASAMGLARDQALALGAATARSANDIAAAQLELTKMGFSMQRVLQLTPAVTNLSIAADMPMQQAANTAGAIMRQFNMQASDMTHIMDVIMRGANQSAADVSDFAGSLRYAGSMAHAANMDLETTVALLQAASNAGMEGYMAGTSLRSLLGDFQTPTPMAAQFFRQFNIQVRDGNGQLRDMIDLIEEVITKVPRNMIGPPFFEVDSANLLNALANIGPDAIRAMRVDDQINSSGEAARTAEARMRGLNGAIETLSGAFETLLIKIGDSGFLKQATDIIKAIGEWTSGLSEAGTQTLFMAGAVAALAVAAGPLLFTISSILSIFTSLQGILLGGLGIAAAVVLWNDLSAAIEGVQIGMDATNESFRETNRLLDEMAGLSRDAQLAQLQLAQQSALTTRQEADRLEAIAREAERRDPRNEASMDPNRGWLYNEFGRRSAIVLDTMRGTVRESSHEVAARARNAADVARRRYDAEQARIEEAYQQYFYEDPAAVEARRVAGHAAQGRLDAARRAAGNAFNSDAWLRANPADAHAIAEQARGQLTNRPNPPTRERFMGFTPGQMISMETARLRRLAEAAREGTKAVDELAAALALREQSRDPMTGAYTLSEARAREIVAEQRALQQQIDQAAAAEEQARSLQAVRDNVHATVRDNEALAKAASQGARAYERMQTALQLMRDQPKLELQEALSLADELQRSQEGLDRMTAEADRWANTWRGMGDAIAGAFEQAILQGDSLGDVLKSLARDILTLVLRAAVIQPMADAITNGLNGSGSGGSGGFMSAIGSAITSIFGGWFAKGGNLGPGQWGIAGENGPEIIKGGMSGKTIVPLSGGFGGGGGLTVDARAYINAQGADPAAVARLERAMVERDRMLKSQVRSYVSDMAQRGRLRA